MITKQYLVLIFILNLFIFQFKKAFTEDELLYTCEYKSTKYVDHKIYGNDSHFLNEYTNVSLQIRPLPPPPALPLALYYRRCCRRRCRCRVATRFERSGPPIRPQTQA